jgi:hypothetical protein
MGGACLSNGERHTVDGKSKYEPSLNSAQFLKLQGR